MYRRYPKGLGLVLAAPDSFGRRPEACMYRSQNVCGLAASFAGEFVSKRCVVDRSICEACAHFKLPAGPKLNPIVASVLFTSVEHGAAALTAPAHIANHQVRQFAIRWLATSGPSPPSTGDILANQTSHAVHEGEAARQAKAEGSGLRIGLVGRNTSFGLGHQNRDIAVQLAVDRWLVPRLPGSRDPPAPILPC